MPDRYRQAAMMAGTTAIISAICELLIEKQIVDRVELRNRLYRLCQEVPETSSSSDISAPIRHLISIIEASDADGGYRD